MIPIARPDLGPEEVAAVTDVLASGMLAGGRRVAELEARWAEFIGVKHAIAVSNGTVALMCIFEGLGLGPGDEVITVGHTFNATVSAILFTGRHARSSSTSSPTRTSSTPRGSRPPSRRGRARSARSTCSACRPTWT